MSETDAAKWKQLYEEMLAATDLQTLKKKAELLEAAMFVRSMQLQNSPDGETELAEIRKAATSLRKIQVERLGFPGTLFNGEGSASSGSQQ